MAVSRNRKNHKQKVRVRHIKNAEKIARLRKAYIKEIEEHQTKLEEEGNIQEILKSKNETK